MDIDYKVWLDHFQYHATRRCVMPASRPDDFTAWERRLIADSLASFQRREPSRGWLLLSAAQRYDRANAGAPLAQIVALLIAEEQHHAALVGAFMDQHGLPRKQAAWTDRIVRRVRRLAGFEMQLAVLVAGALIGKVYYRALEAATGCRQLQTLCRMLVADELAHIGFESELLRALHAHSLPSVRGAKSAAHRAFFTSASVAVWLAHHRVLRAAGYTLGTFVSACVSQYSFYIEPPRSLRSWSIAGSLSALEEKTAAN